MFRKTKEVVTAAAEAVGLAPSLTDAQTAAETHRQTLVLAQSAVDTATVALQAAHDRSAEDAEILKLEAALAAARQEASRAEARYRGAESRLKKARDADQAKEMAAARLKFNEVLAVRLDAAGAIDKLAIEVAALVDIIQRCDSTLATSMRDRVASPSATHVLNTAHRIAELSLSKAGAIPRAWFGDITQHPSGTDLVTQQNGALSAT